MRKWPRTFSRSLEKPPPARAIHTERWRGASPAPPGRWASRILVCLVASFGLATAEACRYTVRDLAFVDLAEETYTLRITGVPPAPTATSPIGPFLAKTISALRDPRLTLEWAILDPTTTPARDPRASDIPTHPEGQLLSPDGFQLTLTLPTLAPLATQAWTELVHSLRWSPTREALVDLALRHFGVMLLLAGEQTEENLRAEKVIQQARDEIASLMRDLPKPVGLPPAMLTLSTTEYAREKMLLWQLGLDATPINEPRVAVIFGKARWVGPLMRGQEISVANLTRLFDFLGADCECGMDLAWTRGTPLLVPWSDTYHAQAAQRLGFDPENPLTKMEASRILARFSRHGRAPAASGYTEVSLEAAAPNAPVPLEETNARTPAASTQPAATRDVSARPPDLVVSLGLPALWGFGGLVLVVLVSALGLVWRARRQRQ